MSITHKKNGFITTILNQSKKDDIVLLKGSPIIETKVVIPQQAQSPRFYKAEPLKNDNVISRVLKKIFDSYRAKQSKELSSAIASELDNEESFITRSRYKKDLKIKENQTGILQKILEALSFGKDEDNIKSKEKSSKLGSFFLKKIKFVKKLFKKLFLPFSMKNFKFIKKLFKKLFLPFAILSALIGGANWEKFKEVASSFLDFMQPLFDFLANIGKNALDIIAEFFEKYPTILEVASGLLDGFTKVYTYVSDKIKDLGAWLSSIWDNYVSPILPGMPSLEPLEKWASAISNKVKALYNKVKNFFSDIADTIDSINPFHKTKEEERIDNLKKKLDKIKELEQDIKDTKEDIKAVKSGNSLTNLFKKSEKELLDILSEQQKELAELNLKTYKDSVKGIKDVAIVGSEELKKQIVKNIETTINNNSPKDEVKMNISNTANLKELQDALKMATSKDSKKSLTRKIKVTQKYYDDLAHIETGTLKDRYNVVNKYGYVGKYQYGKSTALPFLKKLGKKWKDFKGNKELQEKVVRMDTESRIPQILRLKKKFGKEQIVTPEDLWISHNMGMKGYKEIVLQPHLAPTRARVRNMESNVSKEIKQSGVTKEKYINYWENRFDENGVRNESEIVEKLKELIKVSKNSNSNTVKVDDPTVLEFIDDTKEQGVI